MMDRTQLDKIAKYQQKTFIEIQFLKTLMRGFPDKIFEEHFKAIETREFCFKKSVLTMY